LDGDCLTDFTVTPIFERRVEASLSVSVWHEVQSPLQPSLAMANDGDAIMIETATATSISLNMVFPFRLDVQIFYAQKMPTTIFQ
jgi:hypothetical protein